MIAGDGLAFAQCSWPLSRKGSLACHPYCGTWHPFFTPSPMTRDIYTAANRFIIGTPTNCFADFAMSRPKSEH